MPIPVRSMVGKIMMNRLIPSTVVALAALVAPAAMASTILVDDFTTAGAVASNFQGNPAAAPINGAGILGGERYMWVSADTAGPFDTSFQVLVGGGQITFNNSTGVTGQAVLVYDGVGTGPTTEEFTFDSVPAPSPDFPDSNTALIPVNTSGLGGADLLQGGTTATRYFSFDVNSFDNNSSVDFRAYAWDMSGNVATYFENLFNPFPFDIVTFDTTLRLNEFTADAGFDWSDIGALAFSVESLTTEFDGALGSISVVPLPASAFLLLGGLGGLAGMSTASRRRRRKEA